MSDNIFDEGNELKSAWVKFSKIGDFISGTLISVREMASRLPGKEGEMVKVYEIKAKEGSFHDIDKKKQIIEPAIIVGAGDIYNVGVGFVIDGQMRNVKVGQIIGIKYTEDKPNKQAGFNDMKIKKVYAPKGPDGVKPLMDEEWLKENEPTVGLPSLNN